MTDLREQIASTICGDRAVDNWDATDADYETADAILELLKGAVKPLKWEDARFCDTPRETAESLLGTYEVLLWANGDFGGSVPVDDPENSNTEFGGAATMEEAKAAAQADYSTRILAALGVK
jgi:hypothetical protein